MCECVGDPADWSLFLCSPIPSHPTSRRDLGIWGVATYTVQTQQGIGLFSQIPAREKKTMEHQDQTGPLSPPPPTARSRMAWHWMDGIG